MLIKSQAGTEALTKKRGALREPVWKVPASSVTPDNLQSKAPAQHYSSAAAAPPSKHNLNFSSDLSLVCCSAAELHVPPFKLVEGVAHP